MYGPDAAWNNWSRLQEVIYRCQNKKNIVWLLASVGDWIGSGKIDNADVSVRALKTGARSLSDVIIWLHTLKE